MVFACVIAANLFNGLNTNVWTIWVFLAVFFGIGFLLVYTVGISSCIIPHSFSHRSCIGDLRHHFTWLVRYPHLWKQYFPVPFGVLLAMPPFDCLLSPAPSLLTQGMEVRICSWRLWYYAIHPQKSSSGCYPQLSSSSQNALTFRNRRVENWFPEDHTFRQCCVLAC